MKDLASTILAALLSVSFLALVVFSIGLTESESNQRESHDKEMCKVLNGNPNIIQLVQTWPCDEAEKNIDEHFEIIERLEAEK